MKYRNLILAIATVSSFAVAQVSSAHAGGFIGGIINQVAPGVGTALDQAHAQMGRPLDHAANQAAGAAANYFVPGSGPYVTDGLEARDQYNRSGSIVAPPPTGYYPPVLPPMGYPPVIVRGPYYGPMMR